MLSGLRADEIAKSKFNFDFGSAPSVQLQAPNVMSATYSAALGTATNFTATGQFNSLQVLLPASAGYITVTVGQNCLGPVASVSDTATLTWSVAQNIYSVTAADVVNYTPYMDSQDIKIGNVLNAFNQTFAFDKGQYVSANTPAYLTVFCASVVDSTQITSLKITAFDAKLSMNFTYWNQFGAENRKVTFVLQPNSQFVLSSPNPIDTLYFQLSYTGTTGLKYIDSKTGPQDFPPDNNLIFKVDPDSNRNLRLVPLTLTNPTAIPSTINLSVSKYYSLPGWKIAIIVVFSVLGGLAIIVGILYAIIAIIRSKNPAEYPKEPKGVFGIKTGEHHLKSSNDYQIQQKTPIPDTSEGRSPVMITGQGEYPDLEGDQPAFNQDRAVPVRSENFADHP